MSSSDMGNDPRSAECEAARPIDEQERVDELAALRAVLEAAEKVSACATNGQERLLLDSIDDLRAAIDRAKEVGK